MMINGIEKKGFNKTDKGSDILQPGRINFLLYKMLSETFNELYINVRRGVKMPCPNLRSLIDHTKIHAYGYPALDIYNKECMDIERKYGSSSMIDIRQEYEKVQSLIKLLKGIGSFSLNPRYAYSENPKPDDWDFTAFNYDISDVDSNPDIEKIKDFYFKELEKEYQEKPDNERRKEAYTRAKRTYLFYQKYREYEASGYDTTLIEQIFGITKAEQQTLKYWLSQLAYDGMISVLFAPAGQGKTNTGAFIVQSILIMYPRWDVLTNIPFSFAPKIIQGEHLINYQIDRIKFVENMSELLVESANSMLNGRIPVPILDEMDSARIRTQARNAESVSFKAYEYVERHLDTQGPLMIYHVMKDIPTELQPGGLSRNVFGVFMYNNLAEQKSPKRVISNPMVYENNTEGLKYFPVPLTNLPYHAHGFSPFSIDVDMQWLNQQLGITTKEDAARNIIRLIPLRGWERKKVISERNNDKRTP